MNAIIIFLIIAIICVITAIIIFSTEKFNQQNMSGQKTDIELEEISEKTICYINNSCEIDYVETKNKIKILIDNNKTERFDIAILASNYLSLLYEYKDKIQEAKQVLEEIQKDARFEEQSQETKYTLLANLYKLYEKTNDKENQIKTLEEILSLENIDLKYESWEVLKEGYLNTYKDLTDEDF